MADIKQDINESKKSCNCNFKIMDSKLIATFNISDYTEGSKMPYFNVEKVFDNWQDFVDYSMEMFKDQISEEV